MVVPPPLSKFSPKQTPNPHTSNNSIPISLCFVIMCYNIIRTFFTNKNDCSTSHAYAYYTLRKHILGITLTIICRIPGILATGEEQMYWPAKGKTTAYNISRLCMKNFRLKKETEKQYRNSRSCADSCADSTTAASNSSANDTTDKGRARTRPRLFTVCNTSNPIYSHRRG